jgi:hypothetical protein
VRFSLACGTGLCVETLPDFDRAGPATLDSGPCPDVGNCPGIGGLLKAGGRSSELGGDGTFVAGGYQGGGTCLGVGTYSDFGGGEYEGREVGREDVELESSENLDLRRPLLQHQANNTSRIKLPILTPIMMPPACSRRLPVSVVVVVMAASALRATAIPVAPVPFGSGTIIVTHAAVVDAVILADCRSGLTWVSTLSSSCIGRPFKTGLSC